MKNINGNIKMFCLINTTKYNNDGRYNVNVCNFDELFLLGFDESDREKLENMEVDDLIYTDYVGCYLIRIA